MKKIGFILGLSILVIGCKQADKQQENTGTDTVETVVDQTPTEKEETTTSTAFDIETIPFTTADIGDFPFINLPEGLETSNRSVEKKFDVCFFPINGVMTPFEGRLYKANVYAVSGEEYSQRYFEKSIETYLQSIGAVKIFDGEITNEEYNRYNKQDPNKGGIGDIGYASQNIKFWIIRTKDKGNIYVQINSNNAGGKLNVLQEETFVQTITKVTAEVIAKDLIEKGKSILYINFDVDKSVLTAEGQEVVAQIAAALEKDKSLTITIEGHTDNSGDATYNKKLSSERANTVMHSLIADGIDKARLKAKGLGADRPLATNDSEENKAKNRRVELIKS